MRRLQFIVTHRAAGLVQIAREVHALEIVGEGGSPLAQCGKFGAALSDDLIGVLLRLLVAHGWLSGFEKFLYNHPQLLCCHGLYLVCGGKAAIPGKRRHGKMVILNGVYRKKSHPHVFFERAPGLVLIPFGQLAATLAARERGSGTQLPSGG
jgi:hypothetical protein